ncbi:hypothetical protein Taro_042917 [Colocasia esculenta]|uniref:Uncharacterized protein n=1 Tax=Colocasia esculenta TaxID=4460 RepID=A0A843X3C7_COLES|nr:hypothetical protein [Colocasia esculenta]
MDQYFEEKMAARKRSAPPFQRQDTKKAVYQSPQRPVAASSKIGVPVLEEDIVRSDSEREE